MNKTPLHLCLKWAWADDANQKLAHQRCHRIQVPILHPRGVSIQYGHDVGYKGGIYGGYLFVHAETKQLCPIGLFGGVTATIILPRRHPQVPILRP